VGVGLGRVRRMGAVSIRPGISNSQHFCQELTNSLPSKHELCRLPYQRFWIGQCLPSRVNRCRLNVVAAGFHGRIEVKHEVVNRECVLIELRRVSGFESLGGAANLSGPSLRSGFRQRSPSRLRWAQTRSRPLNASSSNPWGQPIFQVPRCARDFGSGLPLVLAGLRLAHAR